MLSTFGTLAQPGFTESQAVLSMMSSAAYPPGGGIGENGDG